MLAQINPHPRDSRIEFDEPTHVYTIDGDSNYKSVTTWIHSFFPHFDADKIITKMRNGRGWGPDNKYYGMTDDEIKDGWKQNGREAAELGTAMHLNIEYYYNGQDYIPGFTDTREHKLFSEYLRDHTEYRPYRTEMTVFSKAYRLAGSIDMLYYDPKYGNDPDRLIIADWKRSKEIRPSNRWERGYPPLDNIDNCNYWHYCLQLNVYRMILEKYYGKKIREMFLVILHPNQAEYKKIMIPRVSKPIAKMLVKRKGEL
jgi:ATP-dependent exoDNAse (exonuclease V) beta subunit